MSEHEAERRIVRISGPASRDLAGIGDYTRREWGVRQRAEYLHGIRSLIAALRDTPGLGVDRSDISDGLRAHPVGRHIVFYRETAVVLIIVRVLHQSMDPERHLGDLP